MATKEFYLCVYIICYSVATHGHPASVKIKGE